MGLDEVKEIFYFLEGFITGDSCMWVVNNEVPELDNKTIRVSLIFCEEG